MHAGQTPGLVGVGGTSGDSTSPIITAGEIFGDGQIIELVGGETQETPRLLLWDGAKETIAPELKHAGRSYKPLRIDRSIVRELNLPVHSTFCVSTSELLAEICKLGTNFAGLGEKLVSVVGRFVLSTWLIESLQLAPSLVISGPDEFRGNRLLELLQCLCRHALRLSGVTPTGLCSLPTGMGFTLLISQPMIGPKLSKLLDDIRKRGQKIPHRGRLLDLFGAQVIRSEFIEGAEFRADRFVEIPMVPGSRQIPALGPDEQRRIAAEFQAKLLGFRCANLGKVRELKFDVSKLSLPLRPLAQSFAAATPDDPKLQAAVYDLLREENEEVRSKSWTQLSTITVEAVQVACFDSLEGVKYVGELAEIAQELLHRRGADVQVDPGIVGRQLRLLGFAPEPRDARGVKLKLTEAVQQRAQQLAQDLGVPARGTGIPAEAPEGEADGSGTESRAV